MYYFLLLQSLCISCWISITLAEHPIACPLGYDTIDSHCFKMVDESMTFWEAVTACDVMDGKLVEIISDEEQKRVSAYVQHATGDLWMGATDLQGRWLFLTSSNKDVLEAYNSWAASYPRNGSQEAKHCASLSLSHGWRWINTPCSYHQGALCEVRLRSAPIVGRR